MYQYIKTNKIDRIMQLNYVHEYEIKKVGHLLRVGRFLQFIVSVTSC